jgi:pyruvate formate lyase activating enzyme
VEGQVLRIERASIHDGPGIRTVVFLKGCPLRCAWCSTPESQLRQPQLAFHATRCQAAGTAAGGPSGPRLAGAEPAGPQPLNSWAAGGPGRGGAAPAAVAAGSQPAAGTAAAAGCGLVCVGACPKGAIAAQGGGIRIDRTRCDDCLACVEACPVDALAVYGQAMTVEQVIQEVVKDEVFYHHSGGGLTVSGGEPLAQAEFTAALTKAAKAHGIHTAIETTLFASPAKVAAGLAHADHLLVDIKLADAAAHRRWTGVPLAPIWRNLRGIGQSGFGGQITVRLPYIPGVNDAWPNLLATARLAREIPQVTGLELLPYHRLGLAAYRALGRDYQLAGIKPPPPAQVAQIAAQLSDAVPGLQVALAR